MKKSITILLILALVAGSVFAATLTGSAQIDFGYNFKNTEWGFKNGQSTKYSFKFEIDTTKVSVGEHSTDIWAELAADASAVVEVKEKVAGTTNVAFSAKITKADIHVADWTFGILGAGEAKTFASAYFKSGNAAENTIASVKNVFNGFTVSYKDWKGGFGTSGNNIKGEVYNIFVHGATPEFKFAEDSITAQGAGYLVYANDSYAGAGAKVGYKADNLTANVAADVKYDNASIIYEVAADAAFKKDLVKVNVYATPGKILTDAKEKAKYAGSYADALALNAKVASKYTFDFDGTAVVVNGSVDARNILIDKREITVAANETVTLGAVKIEASESYAIFAKTLAVSAKATYTAEKFVGYAQANANFDFAAGKVSAVGLEAGVSSTKIVENCTLSLVYKNTNFIDGATKGWDDKAVVNTITASAKIAF